MDTLVEYFHKNFYPDLNIEDVAKAIHSDPVRKEKAVSFIKSKHYSDVDEEVFNKAASSMFNTPVFAKDDTYVQTPYVSPIIRNAPRTAVNSANSPIFNTPVFAKDDTYVQTPYVSPIIRNAPRTAVNSASARPNTMSETQRTAIESHPESVFKTGKTDSPIFNTPVLTKDDTYVQAPYISPIIGNMPRTAVNSANIGPDTRNKTQRDMAESYSESVFRPGITFSEIPQMPLRYMSNPLKALGDMGVFGMPNTTEDRIQRRIVQESPYMTYEEKRSASLNEARDLGINAGINVGTAELGFAIPRSVLTPRLLNVFSQGSKANLTSDLLQLTKTDFDKIKQGDAEEIFNTAINAAGVKSKLGNFDASTVYSNIKNWNNISTDDKIDTFKDLFNLGNAAFSQTQRIK